MSCERFHAALAAHAAGGELDAASARHLAGCAACQDLLAVQQRALAELDAELARTLSISAPPEFAARVIQASADARDVSRRWWMAKPALAGLGIAAVILLSVWVQRPPSVESTPAASLRLNGEATKAGSQTVGIPTATSVASRRVAPVASAFRRKDAAGAQKATAAHSDPPVIVEPSRALALHRLRELNGQGRLDGTVLPPPVTPEAALADLTITPIEVAAIPVPDVEIVNHPPAAPQRQ